MDLVSYITPDRFDLMAKLLNIKYINIRPLSYTTSATDILQNLELEKHAYGIKRFFIQIMMFLFLRYVQ